MHPAPGGARSPESPPRPRPGPRASPPWRPRSSGPPSSLQNGSEGPHPCPVPHPLASRVPFLQPPPTQCVTSLEWEVTLPGHQGLTAKALLSRGSDGAPQPLWPGLQGRDSRPPGCCSSLCHPHPTPPHPALRAPRSTHWTPHSAPLTWLPSALARGPRTPLLGPMLQDLPTPGQGQAIPSPPLQTSRGAERKFTQGHTAVTQQSGALRSDCFILAGSDLLAPKLPSRLRVC